MRGYDDWAGDWDVADVSDIEVHENPYFQTGDIWKHNTQVDELMDRCDTLFPLKGAAEKTFQPLGFEDIAKREEIDHWTMWETLSSEERTKREEAGCGRNQTTLIILPSLWFAEAYSGSATGEAVYAQSIVSHDSLLIYIMLICRFRHSMSRITRISSRRLDGGITT